MATVAAMAVLRAMALGNSAAAMTMAAVKVEARTMATAATALVRIVLVALDIAHFVTCHIVANAIARVVAIAIAFVNVQQRGQCQGQQKG